MRKGFTLIELLAVIVILAIILAIAVPSISKLIDNVRLQAFIDNEEMLVRAAKKMVGIDESYLPKEIGETKEVKLSELQASKYIGAIVSPSDKNKECNGYVLVTKLEENTYDYEPFLNCIEESENFYNKDLIGYWKLDNNVLDYSLSNNTGTKIGSPILSDCKIDQCYQFAEYPSYIELPFGKGLNMSDGYSFSMWVKPRDTSGSRIFFAVNNGSSQRVYISVYSGKWDIGISSSAWSSSISKTVAITEWTQVTLVMDYSTAKLYINGKFSMSKNYSPYTLAGNFTIGNHGNPSSNSTYQFYGYVDDVKVYKRPLSEDEIKLRYNIEKN